MIDMTTTVNDQYFDLMKCHDRYLLPYGGGGSGKSWSVAEKWLTRINAAQQRGYREGFLCLRKTSTDVKRSVFVLLQTYIDKWGMKATPNKTDLSYMFPGGSFISCSGLDDPEKVKSIENITGVWMEETTQFTLADFRQLDLRLRGDTPSYFQIIMTFNPMDDQSFVNDLFFNSEKAPKLKVWDDGKSFKTKNATVLHSTWRDNKWVDDQYVEMLAALEINDPDRWRIYDQGLWTALAQRIYINYEEISPDDWPDHFDETFYGLDFGYSNETALIEINLLDNEIYERELIYETEMKNVDRIARLESLGISKSAEIFADPSELEFIEEIYDAGYNIDGANNKVTPGIDFVNTRRPKILSTSVNHLREKRSYRRKEDRHGNILEDPVKENDHLQDAERYALYSRLGDNTDIRVRTF